MQRAVAHQDEAGVVGHLAPFVEIEGDANRRCSMPASRGARSGARIASAPKAPSTWNQSFFASARVRPAPPDRRSRRCPPCPRCPPPGTASGPRRGRRRSPRSARRGPCGGGGRSAIDAQRDRCPARTGPSPARCSHAPRPRHRPRGAAPRRHALRGARRRRASRVRATSTPIRLAIEVPVTKSRWRFPGKPNSARIQRDDLALHLDRHVVAPAEIGVQAGGQHLAPACPRRCRRHAPSP